MLHDRILPIIYLTGKSVINSGIMKFVDELKNYIVIGLCHSVGCWNPLSSPRRCRV